MDHRVANHEERIGIKTLFADSASDITSDITNDIYTESNLTANQLLVWIIQKLHANSPLFSIPTIFTIHQEVDPACFEKAVQTLINSSDALRTVFHEVHGMPQRLVLAEMPYSLEYVDFSSFTDPDEAMRAWVQARREKIFDLEACLFDSVLIKLSKEKSVWYLNTHHLIGDGWSIAMGFQILSRLYGDAQQGRIADRMDLPAFEDYVIYERDFRQSAHYQKNEAYWQQKLGIPTDPIAFFGQIPTKSSTTAQRMTCDLGVERTRKLKALVAQEGLATKTQQVTLFNIFAACLLTYIYRISGNQRISLGTYYHKRYTKAFKETLGFFVGALPLQVTIEEEDSLSSLIHKLALESTETLRHSRYTIPNFRHKPFYDLSLNFQVAAVSEFNGSPAQVELIFCGHQLESLSLQVDDFSSTHSLKLSFDFHTDVFSPQQQAQIIQHFVQLLDACIADIYQPVQAVNFLSAIERTKILAEFSRTEISEPTHQPIHERFERQAAETPEALAMAFADEEPGGEAQGATNGQRATRHLPLTTLTYHELNARANQLAHYLQARGVGPGTPVGLCLERSPALIIGLLGILKAGGAYVALDPTYPRERLAFIMADTQIAVLVTQEKWLAQLPQRNMHLVCLDHEQAAIAACSAENTISGVMPDDLAYLLYTSGSTGRPKGVMVPHRALANFTEAATALYELHPQDRVLQYATINFDTAAEEIYPCLTSGGTLVLRTDEMLRSVPAFLQTCQAWNLTVLDLPTAFWHELVQELAATELTVPASIRLVIIGGEQALPERVATWRQTVGHYPRLVNTYGPTETTVVATSCDLSNYLNAACPAPIGRPLRNVEIYLLDQHRQPVPIGAPGELYIGGAGVALGYYGLPALTAEKFVPHPFAAGQRLYKTGDMGRWLPTPNGGLPNIEFLGRYDRQVKIHGFRVELDEIESSLRQHPAVRETVVVVREDTPGDKRLTAYLVVGLEPAPAAKELRDFLRAKLPDYMTPSAFVILDALPLTPNGKLDRSALPAPVFTPPAVAEARVSPRTPIEASLIEIWRDVLGHADIGIYDNFFLLGGHSLSAMQIVARVYKMFEVEIPLMRLFETPTVVRLAEYIALARQGVQAKAPIVIQRQSRQQALPLTFSQERMWLLHLLRPESAAYNTHLTIRLVGPLRVAVLEQSLNEIIRRHEILRTTIALVDEQPSQVIAPELKISLTLVDLSELPATRQTSELPRLVSQTIQQPFDLMRGPLIRTTLFRLASTQHVLQVTIHHVASDAWALGVFARELVALYEAFTAGKPSPLPELSIQYADYAAWQRTWYQGEILETQMAYWRQKLADVPVLALPTDRPRPALQTTRGSFKNAAPDPALLKALRTLSHAQGTTLFITLVAAFEVLLQRYTGQVDFAIGMPIANRHLEESENLIGTFINTLVLRADLSGAPSFRELLQRVRQVALEAYSHQDLYFEKLVTELQPTRDLSHSPLFQVMCNGITIPLRGIEFSDLNWDFVTVGSQSSQLDLSLTIIDLVYLQQFTIDYNTDLFDGETIERMLAQYQALLASIVANPDELITRLAIFPDQERQKLLVDWNANATEYPHQACLHQLFEQQAARTPEAIAVVFEDQQLTYQALNQRANQLAAHLRVLGIGPDVFVGICLERSLDLVVGLLGILKAGGAYLPLDPAFPLDRLAYMMTDAQAPVLLTQTGLLPELLALLSAHPPEVVYMDMGWEATAAASSLAPAANSSAVTPDHLAYIIYTSGSTGKPKGVQLPHRNVVNFLTAMGQKPGLTERDIVLAVTTLSFDIAVLEIFLPLVTGAQVVIASQAVAHDARQLAEQLATTGATVMQATPATWQMLLATGWPGDPRLKVLCGGEALSSDLATQLLARVGSLWNMYGPTETTVWSTIYEVTAVEELIPIGRPLANTEIYLLDEQLELAPIGVAGELYIGGAGVARGYLNRPELTSQKFVHNPFSRQPDARLYRTGDLARYRADGNIEFLGRMDNQVKVRGFRIELGEIEAVLHQHPAIEQAVVTAWDDSAGSKYLAAYLISPQEPPLTPAGLRHYLNDKLPTYMIPSAFVILDAFPQTPNGKVDRKRLPHPGQLELSERQTYVAPRTALELQLTKIWEHVLGRQSIGVNDNFFEMGGHSLLAARLFVQIETLMGRNLPLATLFQAPTIQQLAAMMQNEDWTPPWSSLVPIQPGGSKPPFFCVHGFGGDVVGYFELAQWLGDDQPFYGLQAQGLNEADEPHRAIETMAAHYIQAMRSLQPSGPYYLGGYCYGGVVAFEIARQLQQQGHQVALLAIFEGYALDRTEAQKQLWRPQVMFSFLRNLPYWFKDNFQPGGPYNRVLKNGKQPIKANMPYEIREWNSHNVQTILAATWPEMADGSVQRRKLLEAHDQAIVAYNPKPYDGRVTLFRVHAMSLFRAYDPEMGWGKLARQGVELRLLPGAHYNIFEKPYVGALAGQLRDALDQASQRLASK